MDSEKYISSPGSIIIPLETSVYRDLTMGAYFVPPHTDLAMSATFENLSRPVANILFGTGVGVPGETTQTVLSISAGIGANLTGYQFSGDCDATYYVYKNGQLVQRFTTNIMNPNIDYMFPAPSNLVVGDVVQVLVQNLTTDAANFQVALLGSFP